jgi:hypothetical protein
MVFAPKELAELLKSHTVVFDSKRDRLAESASFTTLGGSFGSVTPTQVALLREIPLIFAMTVLAAGGAICKERKGLLERQVMIFRNGRIFFRHFVTWRGGVSKSFHAPITSDNRAPS